MRKFHSYEEVNKKLHYYVPRTELINKVYHSLVGDEPDVGGHYITVWGPRQSGKTWIMREVVDKFKQRDDFEVAILSMQSGKTVETDVKILNLLVDKLSYWVNRDLPLIAEWDQLETFFSKEYFPKPLILILDEFDSIGEAFINKFAHQFRNIYTSRMNQRGVPSGEKRSLLHGLALVGVRSVLGIENVSGSPFNVQRSLPIPNLTFEEVDSMYHWYERESGQPVDQAVIDRVFYETQGQPGLVSWLGEQLTEERFNPDRTQPIDMAHFEQVYGAALYILPNNNLLNLISKARQEPYKQVILELFKTDKKILFSYDDELLNFLYLNGIVSWEQEEVGKYYTKFPSPFVQRRIFNAFARDMFRHIGQPYDPFDDLSDTITDDTLNVTNLMRRYETYLRQNRDWLLKEAPRRQTDGRIMEATYHFNLFLYLQRFFYDYDSRVHPEFPTGNGKIDLIIKHGGQMYGLEVKSFSGERAYRKALKEAAEYGQQLGLADISLVFFCEYITEENRAKYELTYQDQTTGVIVSPVFVVTG